MPGFRRLLDHGEVLNRLSRLPGAWELGVRLKDLRRERPVRRRLGELARSVEEAAGSAESARRILVVSPQDRKSVV